MNRRDTGIDLHDAAETRRGRSRRARFAFTLLELLLVLAVLAALAALTWPALQPSLATERLVKAADLVRVEWTRARVRAMSTGRTMVFRHQAENGRYVVECWEGSDGTSSELDDSADIGMPASRGLTLPEGVLFAGSEAGFDTRTEETAAEDLGQSDPGLGQAVYFYPDGTTSDARLCLVNKDGREIVLTLRGLTGIVNVSDIQSPEN